MSCYFVKLTCWPVTIDLDTGIDLGSDLRQALCDYLSQGVAVTAPLRFTRQAISPVDMLRRKGSHYCSNKAGFPICAEQLDHSHSAKMWCILLVSKFWLECINIKHCSSYIITSHQTLMTVYMLCTHLL